MGVYSESFRQEQKISSWIPWLFVVFLGGELLVLTLLAKDGSPENRQSIVQLMWIHGAVFGAIVVMLAAFKIVAAVDSEAVSVRFWPFGVRRMAFEDITSVEMWTCRPLRNFGGWGYRIKKGWRAYLMRGKQGVKIELAGGMKIFIGSDDTPALYAAIVEACPKFRA